VGEWGPAFALPSVPIHAALLPSGEVLFWDRHDQGGSGHPRLWDPETGEATEAPEPPEGHDVFCGGHTPLADGRLLVAGGHIADAMGQPFAALYDPAVPSWSALPAMSQGRWYPSATRLADGTVLLLSGQDEEETFVDTPEIFDPAASTWRQLTGAPQTWGYYPFAFQSAEGRVFVAGPDAQSRFLDTAGQGGWTDVSLGGGGYRFYGSAVLFEPGRVLAAGGGDPPTAHAEIIDLLAASPAWSATAPMAHARQQLNLTLLPDGTVLATGGTSASGFNNASGGVLEPELWDPATGAWTPLAPMSTKRLYHSVALLLPDARVLAAGGGLPSDTAHGDSNHLDGEIFSPPYLFRGPRPEIVAAPAEVALGEPFVVATAEGEPAARITWLAPASVTHSFNQNQRFLELHWLPATGGGMAIAPNGARGAPPGDYLMFALSSGGVPSEARFVRLLPGIFADRFETGTLEAWAAP
jgi:hypothetical protein